MECTFYAFPSSSEIDAQFGHISFPAFAEAWQWVGDQQIDREIGEVANTEELYDQLSCPENGLCQDLPFTISVEPMADDWRDHPSLSAAERNPSMVGR